MSYLTKNIIATLIMFLLAIFGFYFTPKSRGAFGYKTPMSLKNDNTWNFANNLAKKLFILVVIIFTIIEIILYNYLNNDRSAYEYSFITLTILSLLIIPIIELMLNLKFDKNGKTKK